MENKLVIDDDYCRANISDAEGDLIEISFLGDGCATIFANGLDYIALTRENLNSIIKLLKEADNYFDSQAINEN